MKLSKAFWTSLLVMCALFFLPFVLSAGEPAHDGLAEMGFPLTVYTFGGEAEDGTMNHSFFPLFLVIDMIIFFVVAIISHTIFKKIISEQEAAKKK